MFSNLIIGVIKPVVNKKHLDLYLSSYRLGQGVISFPALKIYSFFDRKAHHLTSRSPTTLTASCSTQRAH